MDSVIVLVSCIAHNHADVDINIVQYYYTTTNTLATHVRVFWLPRPASPYGYVILIKHRT